MDVADQSEMLELEPLKPVIVEIHMDDPLQRHAGRNQLAHPLIGHIRLARPAHACDNRRRMALLQIRDVTRFHVLGNPEFVKFAHHLSQSLFHAV